MFRRENLVIDNQNKSDKKESHVQVLAMGFEVAKRWEWTRKGPQIGERLCIKGYLIENGSAPFETPELFKRHDKKNFPIFYI